MNAVQHFIETRITVEDGRACIHNCTDPFTGDPVRMQGTEAEVRAHLTAIAPIHLRLVEP